MVGVILLQKSEGGTLGMSGGGPGSFMTARGADDLLDPHHPGAGRRAFFILCLVMTMLGGHNRAASITATGSRSAASRPPTPVSAARAGDHFARDHQGPASA